jgi:hypothetical protein
MPGVRCQVKGGTTKESTSEFRRSLGEQISYTVGHIVHFLAIAKVDGMPTVVASNDPRILSVEVTDDLITAHLADGRTISVPPRVVVAFGQCHPRATATLRDYRDWARRPLAGH